MRNGTRPSRLNPTSSVGYVRENTCHPRLDRMSPSRWRVCSSKSSCEAALFTSAAAVSGTVVDRHGAGETKIRVALFRIDLGAVDGGDPVRGLDDLELLDGLFRLGRHRLTCSYPLVSGRG